MKTIDVIVAGIAGTTAFTLFSYLVSETMNKDYKEPKLLGKMVDRIMPGMEEKESEFTGWLIHYLVGYALAASYKMLINKTGIKPSVRNGVITGALTGFPATLAWDNTLKIHPLPPRKRSVGYYFQVAIGHAIFGAVSFFVLGAFSRHTDEHQAISAINDNSPDSKLSPYATAGS